MLSRYRFLIINVVVLLALLASHWGRSIEGMTFPHTDFLQKLPLAFHDWPHTDVALDPTERDILQPDAVLVRRFQSPDKDMAEIAVIAGHRKRSIHTPGFCMAGGGWETLWQHGASLTLPDRTIVATRALMTRDGQQLLATYFFTDGDYSTRDLVQFQGVQMLKRFRAEIPLGALVRILVQVRTTPADAEKISTDFAQTTLPVVMASLRNTKLRM